MAELDNRDINTMDEEQFGEVMLARVRAAPPLIEKAAMYDIEEHIRGDVNRRAAFAVASMAGEELIEIIGKDREFAVAAGRILRHLDDMKTRYQELLDLFEALQARLAIAVAVREDMTEILAESRTEPVH